MKLEKGKKYITRNGKTAIVLAVGLSLRDSYTVIAKIIEDNEDGSDSSILYTENGEVEKGKKMPYDIKCSVEDFDNLSLKENFQYFNAMGNKVVILDTKSRKEWYGCIGYEVFYEESGKERHELSTYSVFGQQCIGSNEEGDILISTGKPLDNFFKISKLPKKSDKLKKTIEELRQRF